MYQYLEEILNDYKARYDNVLKVIYPSNEDSGFVEDNQTFNFLMSCENVSKEQHPDNRIISWTQYQVAGDGKDKKDNHLDGIVIDTTAKEVFLIEAKRFQNQNKCDWLYDDAKRAEMMASKKAYLESRLADPSDLSSYSFYLILLADEWVKDGKGLFFAEYFGKKLFPTWDRQVKIVCSSSGTLESDDDWNRYSAKRVNLNNKRYAFIDGYDYFLLCYSMKL